MIPILSARSGFSFRRAYGSPKQIAERIIELCGDTFGMIDDDGTWGHIEFEKACIAADLKPIFGTRIVLEPPDDDSRRLSAPILATDTRQFYRFTSQNSFTPESFNNPKGFVRFAGNALTDPELFDYVDIDQRSIIGARLKIKLSEHTNKPLVLMPWNDYPGPQHRDQFLAWVDSKRLVTQHIMDENELRHAYSFLDDDQFQLAAANTHEVAERCRGLKLAKAPMIHVEGDLNQDVKDGIEYRLAMGQLKEWTKEYQDRVDYELRLIAEKKFESYFLIVGDMVRWAKERMLVGPGRGSSAGSLICYLLRITEVDPLVHNLLFERFIDMNRMDLPDIDIDFSDKSRHLVFEYMAEKYGAENTSRLGNISRLQSRSVIHHVTKKMGIPQGAAYSVINVIIEHSSGDARYGKGLEDTLIETAPGREFTKQYPEASVMCDLEDHPSHTSVHAAALMICHEPLVEFCTIRDGVAQLDKEMSEYINLLKIDALGLRTLGVIEDSECVSIAQLYGLALDDQAAFDIINQRKFAGLFQFEGAAQRRITTQIPIDCFAKINHVTALARPGPLGGGGTQKYIERNSGKQKITYIHDSMASYLDYTQGTPIFQEQVMRLVREIGNFSWEETALIRKGMSASKGPEFFMKYTENFIKGAARLGISREVAYQIFYDMRLMGAWTMNESHTCSYAMISYWCAWLKAHHPIEYCAALLRNAKDDIQTIETLRELKAEGIEYIAFDPMLSDIDWSVQDGKLVGGFKNIVGIGEVKATTLRESRTNGPDFAEKIEKAMSKGIKFMDLYPTRTLWNDYYQNPRKLRVYDEIKEFGDLKNNENSVVICRIDKVDRRDENETVRISRRNGKKWDGPSLFVDVHVTDDSVSRPIVLRFRPDNWDNIGVKIADNAAPGKDWLLVRGKWLEEFNMMIGKKAKCLTNDSMFA